MFESEFERSLFALRQEKLKQIAALGHAAYPNHYRTTHDIPALRAHFDVDSRSAPTFDNPAELRRYLAS